MTTSTSDGMARVIGPYRIEKRLGAGGMGQVYRAYDERLDRRVALKQIKPRKAGDPRARERFLREARAAAGLSHPSIVQVYDILQAEGGDWIVMELVRGKTLRKVLEAGPLPVPRAVTLTLELAAGLAEAHRAGVVHRDLKAENVLLETASGRARILDFGLAKRLLVEEGDASLTVDGQLLGTPRAMSPEQATGQAVDHRSDLFSLGSLAYEVVAGAPPFEGRNSVNTLQKICTHRQPPLKEVRPEVPAGLSNLVDRLLEKNPAHRPQTTDEVVVALRHLAQDMGFELSPSAEPAPPGAETETLDGASSKVRLAERRQVTVMCCDLVTVAESSGSLDPESLYQVLPLFQELAEGILERHGGQLETALSHRLLVYFGFPQAHEDDSRRAVRAALELVEAAGELGRRPPPEAEDGVEFAVRVGIHTGPAVVLPAPQEKLALGQTLDLATGLAAAAAPDSVVASAATHRLIDAHFLCAPPSQATVPGFDGPVESFRVTGAREIHSRAELAARMPPLIGREQELDLLLSRWRPARRGTGQAVLLSGEAGIGKTRLVRALEEHLAADPEARWLICHGAPHTRNSAFDPILDLVRRLLDLSSSSSDDLHLERLEAVSSRLELPLAEVVPLLAPLLSLEVGDRYPSPSLSPERQRKATFEALLQIVLETAEHHPTAWVVEDLHWLDPSSLELLGMLIEQIATLPLLLILTFRPEFETPWSPRTALTRLHLNRLESGEAETLIDRVAGDLRLPAPLRRQIVDRTDGIPLFVEELTKTVLEADLPDGDTAGSRPSRALDIPSTLRDSLTARLDRQGTAKEVAQLASVLGREFSFELLAAVSPLERDDLAGELDRLVRAELLYRRGFARRARYVFKHALIQDAAYGSLLRSQRRQYHGAIAGVLEESFSELVETRPEVLAGHYAEAGRHRRAVAWWQKAGRQAAGRSAYLEAVHHWEAGLESLSRLPESAERVERELVFQLFLGSTLIAVQGFAAGGVERAYRRARELCRRVEDPVRSIQALVGLHTFYLVRAELATAREIGEQCLELAARLDHPARSLQAHIILGNTLYYLGEFEPARELLERGLSWYDPENRPRDGLDPGIATTVFLGWSLARLGHLDQGLGKMEEAIRRAEELRHPFSIACALSFAVVAYQLVGDAGTLLERAEALIALGTEQSFPHWAACGVSLEGWAIAARGEVDEGIARMRQGLEAYEKTGARISVPYQLGLLAEGYLWAGKIDEGLAALDRATEILERHGERCDEAELHRLRGELLAASDAGDPSAEDCFREALEVSRRQGARTLELRAATSLARLRHARGESGDARRLVEEVYGRFREGFETRDLRAARELLAELP